MSPSSERQSRALRWLLGGAGAFPWGAALVLSAGLLGTIVAVPYLPTHDGPQHLFLGQLAVHYRDQTARYPEFFEPGFPVTALGFHALFVPFARLLPWTWALRTVLSIVTLGWAWAFARLTWVARPERALVGLLGFPAALGWTLYMGFFSYQTACALGMLLLGDAYTDRPWGKLRMMRLVAWFTATALAHVFVAELALGVLGVGLLAGHPPEHRAKSALKLLGVATPALLIGALAWLGREAGAKALLSSVSLADKPWLLLRTFVPGPYWRSVPLAGLALVGVALGAPWRTPRPPAHERALWWGGLAALVAATLAPISVAQWDFLFPRFTPLAVVALLGLVPTERLSLARQRWAAVGVAAFGLASLGWAFGFHLELAARARDALSGLERPLRRTGPRLPLVLDPYAGLPSAPTESPVPYFGPLLNLGALYCAAQGGIPPRAFSSTPSVHPFLLTRAGAAAFPLIPDPESIALAYGEPGPTGEERAALVDWLAPFGAQFDDVILWGRPADHDRLLGHGFAADWQQGGLLIAHFQGCAPVVDVALGDAAPAAVVIDYGWVGGAELGFTARARAPRAQTRLRLASAPCGALWYQPRTPGMRLRWQCSGELARDRFVVELRAPGTVLSCQTAPVP